MDWKKLNETIDPRWHEIDNPIPVYHSKEKLEPKQIYISIAGIYDTPYYQMCKEYMDHLAYERSCRVTPIYLKVSEEFAHYLEANHKYEMSYKTDDVPSGIYAHWTGIPIVVDDELKDKLYEFEFKTEQEKQKFERGLRAKIPSLYNDVMTEDGLTLMINGHVEELAKKITAQSIVKNLDELEELIEQKYKENNDATE